MARANFPEAALAGQVSMQWRVPVMGLSKQPTISVFSAFSIAVAFPKGADPGIFGIGRNGSIANGILQEEISGSQAEIDGGSSGNGWSFSPYFGVDSLREGGRRETAAGNAKNSEE